MRLCRSIFRRVPCISREDQDNKRADFAADNLPFHILEETCTLPSENEIFLANINMRKQADDEHRKARKIRKAMPDLTNVVDEGVVLSGAIAKPVHKKGTSKKIK